jgi:hypothetical protein
VTQIGAVGGKACFAESFAPEMMIKAMLLSGFLVVSTALFCQNAQVAAAFSSGQRGSRRQARSAASVCAILEHYRRLAHRIATATFPMAR